MDKKEYYAQLLTLYEAAGAGTLAGTVQAVPQEQIADQGDVSDPALEGGDPAAMGADPMMADPMMQGIPQAPAEPNSDFQLEKEKAKKLFNLFKDLENYGKVFNETIECIDISLLDFKVYKLVLDYSRNISELVEKINNYLTHIFNLESYDKELYTYILFRTEMITNIKGLRDILKLNKPDEEI